MMARAKTIAPGRWVLLALGGVLLALLALKALDTVRLMLVFFNWPFQFDESEGMIVLETLLLDKGTNIFGPINDQLFITAPYPPLYYLLTWPFIHFVGASFKVGRALTFLASVGCAALIFAVVTQTTKDKLAGLGAALGWLCLALVGFWGVLVKPDMLGVFFGLCGLAVALSSDKGQTSRIWWSLPLFLAAFFTKQTSIAPALAVCVWLLLLDWRKGLRFSAILGGIAIGASLLLDLATSGGYFYHELTLHSLPWNFDLYAGFIDSLFLTYLPVLGLGALTIVVLSGVILVRLQRQTEGLPALVKCAGSWSKLADPAGHMRPADIILLLGYLLTGLLVSVGAGTYGGNHNHLLEWCAGCSIGFGLALHLLLSQRVVWRQLVAGLALLALVLFARTQNIVISRQLPSIYDVPEVLSREYRAPPQSLTDGLNNIAQYVSNTSGPIYTDRVDLLLVTNKWQDGLWTTDPFTQTHASYYGRWDESALVDAIKNKQFELIVIARSPEDIPVWLARDPHELDQGSVSHGILSAVQDAYQIDQRNVEFIYKPK